MKADYIKGILLLQNASTNVLRLNSSDTSKKRLFACHHRNFKMTHRLLIAGSSTVQNVLFLLTVAIIFFYAAPTYAEQTNTDLCATKLLTENHGFETIDACNKALVKDPNCGEIYYMRGVAYLGLKNYQGCIDDFTKVINLKPDFAEAYANRGQAYIECKYSRMAVEDLSKAISLKTSVAEFYCLRAEAFINLAQPKGALEDFDDALKLNPQLVHVYELRGLCYATYFKQYQQAIDDFTRVIELDPENGGAYANRAHSYQLMGNEKLAEADRKKANELDSDYLICITKAARPIFGRQIKFHLRCL